MEQAETATRECRTCGEIKPPTEFDIRADTGKGNTQCKHCRREYQNLRNARSYPRDPRPVRAAGTTAPLMCTRCAVTKLADAFPRRRRHADELHCWCRDCFAELHAAYYARYREREIVRIQRNKERARQAARSFVDAYLAVHPCVDCGESDRVVLEFDHIGEKRKDISLMVAAGYLRPVIAAEIAKCEVRCGNDHRRKSEQRRRAARHVAEAGEPWLRVVA